MMLKIKANYDEAKERLKFVIEENNKLIEANKIVEEKNNNFKFAERSLKYNFSQKEIEINELKEAMLDLENFKIEKIKIEKKVSDYSATITNLKEELE